MSSSSFPRLLVKLRKELRGYKISILEKALKELDYERMGHPAGFFKNDWRKANFHIILTEKPDRIILQTHIDPKYQIGRTRSKGKDLEQEVKEITKAYKRKLV